MEVSSTMPYNVCIVDRLLVDDCELVRLDIYWKIMHLEKDQKSSHTHIIPFKTLEFQKLYETSETILNMNLTVSRPIQ